MSRKPTNPGEYAQHNRRNGIPEAVRRERTTAVGKKIERSQRPTDELVVLELRPDVMDAIVAKVSERLEQRLNDIDERLRGLEFARDNGGKRR